MFTQSKSTVDRDGWWTGGSLVYSILTSVVGMISLVYDRLVNLFQI